ncbi:Deoxycytidine monophosphate (dCMP) deaminase [Dipsacomyces acuminosporus]|nr:Deoxycytidine monophosphate (dCMP) deaminase [Dipsacomyces acuminosporus]
MFIGIIGSTASGKEEVANYLVSQLNCTRLYLAKGSTNAASKVDGDTDDDSRTVFQTAKELLAFVTPRWRNSYVTTDVTDPMDLYLLWKRPFFLVVGIDAPMGLRYKRLESQSARLSLEAFVERDDRILYTRPSTLQEQIAADDADTFSDSSTTASTTANTTPLVQDKHFAHLRSPVIRNVANTHGLNLKRMLASANILIANTFPTLDALYEHLDKVDLLNAERLRPSWDTYFMLLSELASHRANCMKRKVGCILVKDNQIIATGYNGTPKGITNCNEGGCPRCNAGTPCGVSLDHCLCIHAEENALLEAGRGRVRNAEGVVLYCNTCPCLGCAKKIVQVGVKTVVYSKGYGMDDLTLRLFKEAGIVVRQHTPPTISMEIGSP